MKRTAIASCIASIGLLGLMAAPAGASPAEVAFDNPEECFFSVVTGTTFCFRGVGVVQSNSSPGGVTKFTGHTTNTGDEYAGNGKSGTLLAHSTTTEHFVFVFGERFGGLNQIEHQRVTIKSATASATCTLTYNFMLSGDQLRHFSSDFECQ